jgi:hypothetical protein
MANAAAARITLPANFTRLKHMANNLTQRLPAKTLSVSSAKQHRGTANSSQASPVSPDFEEAEWLMTSCLAVRTREYAI